MRQLVYATLLGAGIAAAPAPLAAQAACGGLVKAPAVGGWSEYMVRVPGSADLRTRFAIVGTESRGDARFLWFETRVSGSAGVMISQVLVPGYPYEASTVQGVVLKNANRPAMALGPNLLVRARERSPRLLAAIATGCRTAQLVGDEQITVGAVKFRARHYRSAQSGTDLWLSADHPFGLLRMTNSQDRSSMELLASGKDAKSSITETPRLTNGPPS